MFVVNAKGIPYRHWEEGDPEPTDCDRVRDFDGGLWRKAKDWKLAVAQLEAYGIPPGATCWVTDEGDQTFWEDILSIGPAREDI